MITYNDIHDRFRKIVLSAECNVSFWKRFLTYSAENYKNDRSKNSVPFSAIYSTFDIDLGSGPSYLKTHPDGLEITKDNMLESVDDFFNVVKCLLLIRMYNEVEMLLLRAIWINHFNTMTDPLESRNAVNKIVLLIRNDVPMNPNNNKEIIDFIRKHHVDFDRYLSKEIIHKSGQSVETFFDFISMLRHVVAHNGMVLYNDTLNALKSKSKYLFDLYFEPPVKKHDALILKFKDEYKGSDPFTNLTSLIKQFGSNSIKFISGASNLKALGFN